MSTYKYDKTEILEKTNGGLDIITHCYPDAIKNGGGFCNFKTHEETHPSSRIFKAGDTYVVKNFTSGESISPFDCIIQTQSNVNTFAEAIQWTVATFNLGNGNTTFGGAELIFKDAIEGQNHGNYFFEYKEKLTAFELSVLGPLITQEIVDTYALKSAISFTQIKQYHKGDKLYAKYGSTPQQIITRSTDTYPIFVFDYDTWQKVYQPLNKEKQYRFRYIGSKPKDFVFGLDTLDYLRLEYQDNYELKDGEKVEDIKLPAVIIGSGDRDALNIASMQFPVVWLNSESAKLEYPIYKVLKEYTDQVYYCGDIDGPGIEQGIEIGLQYIDLKVIWLPEYIKKIRYRGKPGKDLKDWVDATYKKNDNNGVQHLINQFKKMVSVALPARFWDIHFDDKGVFKKYSFNNQAAFQFLWYNGYHTYKDELNKNNKKNPFSFIQIKKGVVERRDFHEVANYPGNYVIQKMKPNSLVNFLHRSGQLSERMLSKLPQATINFKDSTPDSQFYFFENEIWKVTATGIEKHRYGNVPVYVWKDKIIPHKVHIDKDPVFKITNLGTASHPDYDIEILRTDNPFFNFLINTSRVHWKVLGNAPFIKRKREIEDLPEADRKVALLQLEKEYNAYHKKTAFTIDEAGLSQEQIKEQKQHLINKIFAIGYLLHKHKRLDKSWIVYAMDDRVSDSSEAHGGSGKSIVFNNAIKEFLTNYKDIDGSDSNVYNSAFLFDGVTKDTDYVNIEDADKYFPIKNLKSKTTGNTTVNPKGTSEYTITFDDSPKMAVNTNFALYDADPSLRRRLLMYVASDYYHFEEFDLFQPTHTPFDDFGKLLIKDFDAIERNGFFNVMAQMCQFFMSTPHKLNPPQGNIKKRNAIQSIGDALYDWANSFFENRKNCYVPKNEAFDSFEATAKVKGWTSQKFKKKLKTWCEIDGYEFNPYKSLNKQGYCKHNKDGKTQEFIYIRTPGKEVKEYNSLDQSDQVIIPLDIDKSTF